MSTLYICTTCNTEEKAVEAVYSTSASEYVGVKACPDCEKEGE